MTTIHQYETNTPIRCQYDRYNTISLPLINHRYRKNCQSSTDPPIHIPIPANASVKCKNTLNTLATCIGRYWGRIGCGLSDKYKSANFFNTNLNLFQNAMNSINLCQWLCCLRDVCHKKTGKCGNFEKKKRGGGVYPNPTSFVIWPSDFWYAKFILRC